jgi:hypothetical protein
MMEGAWVTVVAGVDRAVVVVVERGGREGGREG